MSSAFLVTDLQLAAGIAWIWVLSCSVQCVTTELKYSLYTARWTSVVFATSLAIAVITGFRSKCVKFAP